MSGTTVNKPPVLQHAKTIHRPFVTYVCLEGVNSEGLVDSVIVNTPLNTALLTAGRNQTAVPFVQSADIDTQGVVTLVGENRVLVYENGSQNVFVDPVSQEEIYGRITATLNIEVLNYQVEFFYLNNNGEEISYEMPEGPLNLDLFVPYRFSFEKLPDDAMIRVKSKRVNDDGGAGGGREVMEILIIEEDGGEPAALTFTPVPGSFVWGHLDGHTIDSLPGGAFETSGKDVAWTSDSYDLSTTDRMVVHYETFEG